MINLLKRLTDFYDNPTNNNLKLLLDYSFELDNVGGNVAEVLDSFVNIAVLKQEQNIDKAWVQLYNKVIRVTNLYQVQIPSKLKTREAKQIAALLKPLAEQAYKDYYLLHNKRWNIK